MPHRSQWPESLLRRFPGRTSARRLLHELREAPAEQLDEVLRTVHVPRLLSSLRCWHRRVDLRDELLDLLTVRRVHELSDAAVARLITALQRGHTPARQERALRDLLRARCGVRLTELKNIVNLTQGRHDLQGLVFSDIARRSIRREVLEHFRAEAGDAVLRESKVLSDIDDTALARIHEKRYPKGTVIPGVLAFYDALDLGPDDTPLSRGDLTFVTARPSDAWGLMKGQSRETLTDAGVVNLSIMTGSWLNLTTHDAMAAKKVKNISHYAQLFPEYNLVFIGDSGQGDVAVARAILAEHGDVVRACFIHDVVGLPRGERERLAQERIWVVDTYVGAARKARELGLISAAGLQHVIAETRDDLDEVAWESREQERAARELVERDVSAAQGNVSSLA